MDIISWNDFEKIDIRVGTIIEANEFPKAKKPAYQLIIDFGETLGIRKSSAQITKFYTLKSLVGTQIIAVVNFPPKKIADFISECLVLGIYTENNEVVLLHPGQQVSNGLKIG
jgi:tRNA-binding protein